MFCDYCNCSDCQEGQPWLSNAPTEGGRHICDVCWEYDICADACRAIGKHRDEACDNHTCTHRPTIIGPWKAKVVAST